MARAASQTTTDQPTTESSVEPSASADHATDFGGGVAAAETTPSQQTDTAPGATEGEAESEFQSDLISKDRYDALKSDPMKLHKELNRAATQKFQQLAATRKELEPYAEFIKDLQADPIAAIRSIAPHFGLDVHDPKGTADTVTVDLATQVAAAVKESLGPEYEDLADRLSPAIMKAAELVVKEQAKPIADRTDELVRESAARESAAVLEAFGKKFPEWKKVEPKMVEIAKRYQPKPGVSEAQYLEDLYYLANRDSVVANEVKRTVTRMSESADKAAKDVSPGVSANKVSQTLGRPATFSEAWNAAKAGRRLE